MIGATTIPHNRALRATTLLAIGALSLAACKGTDDATASNAPIGMVVGPENVAVVKADEIRSGPAISGNLEAESQATVRAEVGGAVLETMVEQGDRVSAGQTLARLDDATLRAAELAARSQVTTLQNAAEIAKRQVDRSEALIKAGAIAERDLELVRNQHQAADAQLDNARALLANAQKQLTKATIVAPIAGVVSARQVSAGDVLAPGGAAYTIVNPSTMRLEASVPADQLSSVRVGAPVDFVVNGYPNRQFTGRVTRINPVADPSTRQVRIIVSLPNASGTLVGGLFADGHVASEVRNAPILPINAVDERGLKPYVMLIKNGVVQKAEVELGIRDASTETVEVRGGVAAGDTILLGAARGISEKTPVKVNATTDTGKK